MLLQGYATSARSDFLRVGPLVAERIFEGRAGALREVSKTLQLLIFCNCAEVSSVADNEINRSASMVAR